MEDRTYRVIAEFGSYPNTAYSWHSVSCICEECLDLDALYIHLGNNGHRLKVDMTGLTNDKVTDNDVRAVLRTVDALARCRAGCTNTSPVVKV